MADTPRRPLTSRNAARAKTRRQREELARNPVYDLDAAHRSEHEIRIGLSTSSVYPMTVRECFETAARLGYDGGEVMITNNEETQDPALMHLLSRATDPRALSATRPAL